MTGQRKPYETVTTDVVETALEENFLGTAGNETPYTDPDFPGQDE